MADNKFNIELMPGLTLDLNESLDRGDLINGKTREEVGDEGLAPAGENAAVEGAESKVTAPEVKPEVKVVEPEVKPAQVEEPQVQTFKIKYAGEEKELKLTPEQLINKLQKAEDYDRKIAKLAEDRREVEPFKHILETPKFKTFLEEGVADGSFTGPTAPPPDPEDAVFDHARHTQDPDFEIVRAAMREWAITLPAPMQHQLDSNKVIFNREYDRIAEKLRAPRHTPPVNLTPAQTKQVDKVIQAKERAKDSARVESPGSESEINPNQAKEQRVRELSRLMKKGGPHADEIAAEYLLLTRFSA